MSRNVLTQLVFGLAILAGLGCSAKSGSHARTSGDYDLQFLDEVTDHLMHDLRIAKACKGKNIKTVLSAFCVNLQANQQREHQKMVAWMKGWYGREASVDSLPLWLESQDGETFEKYFLEGVLRDHDEIANRAIECTTRAKHPELRDLCQSMAVNRKEEARKMKGWNCEWFKRCD